MDAKADFKRGVSPDAPSFQTEEDVIRGAYHLLNDVRDDFRASKFRMAEFCLDFLEEYKMWDGPDKTKIRMRRDLITPDFLHEVRQDLAVKGFIQDGLLTKRSRHGSVENLVCAIMVHDLGEDFNILPRQLYEYLLKRIDEQKRSMPTQEETYYRTMARRVTNIMEIMTMERKYTADEIRKTLDLPPGARIDENHLEAFLNELRLDFYPLDTNAQGLQIIADPKKHGNGYVVSRYINSGIRDWNSYLHHMLNDPFAILAKFFDRNEGLSTRIGKNFDVRAYARYLSMTEQSFSFDDIARRAAKQYPEFAKAFKTLDSMMGVLYRIGRTYVNHHMDLNREGSKGFAIRTSSQISFREYFPSALYGYRKLPEGINPLSMILGRIRTSFHVGGGGEALNRILQSSIEESTAESPESRGILKRMSETFGQTFNLSL